MKWVLAIHWSRMDGTLLRFVEGSADEIKWYLVQMVKSDRESEARDGNDSWNHGTESVDEVQENKQGIESLYAFGDYDDFHIDYTAKRVDCMSLYKI